MQLASSQPTPRDYSLHKHSCDAAEKRGLVSAQWHTSPISRKRMKELMQRKDGPAIRDTVIWFALLLVTGVLGYVTWGTWWAIPTFAVYGVLYGSVSDSRWHECSHGTAFKTDWMNHFVYQMATFMVMREPTPWRWSHTRHHSDTIIVGCDPEIAVPRPPVLRELISRFFSLKGVPMQFYKLFVHSFGNLTESEKTYIPVTEWKNVYGVARIHLAIYAVVIAWAVVTRSVLPLMYVGLPAFYGAWLMVIYGLTQHAGLAEDVLDHRLNCRTVYMNFINRFLYWNMNYHVEHHMFPMVPYHALPALHEEMKADSPTPYNGLWEAYCEIIPALIRQSKDPSYYVQRELPKLTKSVT